MALPAISFTCISRDLYHGKTNERERAEIIKVIEGLCQARMAFELDPRRRGSMEYLTEYGWFLGWLERDDPRREKFPTTKAALNYLKRAAKAKKLASKESILFRLFKYMAKEANSAWRVQRRRECQGDD